MKKGRARRLAAAVAAVALLLAGCVSTETTSTVGAPSPASPASAGASGGGSQSSVREGGTSPLTSGTTRNEELRRRASIRLELAATHYQQQNFPLALQEAEQSISLDPSFSAGYGMLGLIYMSIGDRVKADDNFKRAISLDPNDAELNNNFGWYLCQSGRQKESLVYFNKALEDRLYLTPAKPLHNAGICLLQTGDEAGAENYFLRAFQVDPGNAVAMYNLGQLYLKQRNLERAKFYSDRLMSGYQPTAETLWLSLRVARASANQEYAGQMASRLRQLFPASREAALLQQGAFGD